MFIKFFFHPFLFFSLWLFIPVSQATIPGVAENWEESRQAVWKISNSRGNGTGFFISPHLLVTNFHVVFHSLDVEDLENLKLTHESQEEQNQIKRILALSPSQDLAILETEKESPVYLKTFEERDIVEKEKWYIQGYPSGTFEEKEKTGPLLKNLFHSFPTSSAREARGYSGSPVLNHEGEAIGVIAKTISNLMVYTPASHLKTLKEGSTGVSCRNLTTSECMDQAWKLIEKKAEEGDSLSQMRLAYYIKQNSPLEYLKWLKEAADQGYPEARHALVQAYFPSKGWISSGHFFNLLQDAAWQNFPPAQHRLAIHYLHIYDMKRSIFWIKKSADNGYSEGIFLMGIYYINNQQKEKGLEFIEKAAEQGLYKAQIKMAKHYMNSGNTKEGVYWLESAFILSNLKNPYFLSELKNIPYLMKAAAEGESAKIQYYFGLMHMQGLGVDQNQEEAWKWIRRSSENGFELATSRLKNMRY